MDTPDSSLPSPPPLDPAPPAAPQPPWGFWSTLGLGLIAMGVMFGAQILVAVCFAIYLLARHQAQHGQSMPFGDLASSLTGDPMMLALAVFVSVPAVFFTLWLMVRLRRGPGWNDYLGLRGFSLQHFLVWGAALAAVVMGGGAFLSWLGDESGAQFAIALLSKGQSVPLLVAALVLGAPLVEEALFRGFMYRGMIASPLAPLGAVLVPNVLWALLHVQYRWSTILMLFTMGLVLGCARHFSRSTALPFVLHLLSNSASVAVAFTMIPPAAAGPP